jgi:hypothetical protein
MRIRRKEEWYWQALLVMVFVACAAMPAGAGTLFSEQVNWTAVRNASDAQAHGCKSAEYSIAGPGIFKVREVMDPNGSREFFNHKDGVFTWTTHEGWEQTFREYRVGGKVVPNRGPEGVPVENRFEFKVPARKYTGRIAICPPVKCNLATCDRLTAMTSLQVEFSGGGSAMPKGSPAAAPASVSGKPTASQSVAGTWGMVANGYPGKIEIGSGTPPSVRMLFDITGKWEKMTNVVFNPVNGEISFTRPWSGNPNFQKYRGKITGNAVVGTFTDSNQPGKSFPWKGERR